MLFKNANIFTAGSFTAGGLRTNGRVIAEISESLSAHDDETVIDCGGKMLLPGLVDIHTHGCAGEDFSDGAADIAKMTEWYAGRGIASVCATVMTMAKDDYRVAVMNICGAINKKAMGSEILGIYAEGPFLSVAKKGAHDERFLSPPDADYFAELDGLAGGNIKIAAIDPDYENAEGFIKTFSSPPYNKVISLGHTACDYETASRAFNSGAKCVTHLFNAMNPLLHREPGLIGAFVDTEGIFGEIICDNVHVAPPVIRMMFSLCADRMVLISDSMRAAGLADGEYELGGIPVFVNDGVATQKDGTIAGSTADLLGCLRNAVQFGVPVDKAISAATETPAKLVGADDRVGSLKCGCDADIIVLDKDFNLCGVYLKGAEYKKFNHNY